MRGVEQGDVPPFAAVGIVYPGVHGRYPRRVGDVGGDVDGRAVQHFLRAGARPLDTWPHGIDSEQLEGDEAPVVRSDVVAEDLAPALEGDVEQLRRADVQVREAHRQLQLVAVVRDGAVREGSAHHGDVRRHPNQIHPYERHQDARTADGRSGPEEEREM